MSVPASILYLNVNYVGRTANIDSASNRIDPIAYYGVRENEWFIWTVLFS